MRTHYLKVRYLLLALLLLCANGIFAYTHVIDEIYYEYNELGKYMVVTRNYNPTTQVVTPYEKSEITVPESVTVNGVSVPVRYIASDAFYGCTNIKKVNLPNSIEKIMDSAFYGCTKLATINIPTSLKEICQNAFYGCVSLYYLENFGSSSVTTIGDNAFAHCDISMFNLPYCVETIGASAFENAIDASVKSISLPQSLKRIGDKAFAGVRLETITLPKNVTSIGYRAFDTSKCTNISVDGENKIFDSRNGCKAIIDKWNNKLLFGCSATVIPEGIEEIGTHAFYNCSELKSVVIPSTVTAIGDNAFFGCVKLESVKILGNVTELKESCFNKCPIKDLKLPESLRKIDDSALNSLCMQELTLPSNLYYIGEGAIGSSTIKKITFPSTISYLGSNSVCISTSVVGGVSVYFEGDEPGYVAEDAFGQNSVKNYVLYVKNEYASNFEHKNPWMKFYTMKTYQSTNSGDTGSIEDVNYVDLIDGQVYDAVGTRRAATLTYTRNFQNTLWQALYVPFPMSYDDWKDNFDIARLNAIRMYDTDDNGEYDETELEILKVSKGTLYPNHPYFIKAKTVGSQTITLSNALVYPAENNSIDCSTVETSFKLTGTYSVVPGTEMVSNRYYALSGGQFCYTTNTNAYLNPNRWYMKISERGSQVYINNSYSRIRVSVKGEYNDGVLADYTPFSELFDAADGVTTISSLEAASQDSSPVFSVDGRLVSSNASSLSSGLYIKNGKKMIVR